LNVLYGNSTGNQKQIWNVKTSTIIGLVKTFIKDEIIEHKYGEYIRKAYKNRVSGDYDTFIEFKKDEVLEMFEELKDFSNYSATKYGIFATDCTNLRRFKTTKGGLLAKID